jgi:hypothetical protein
MSNVNQNPTCEWCGGLATHLAIRADESEYLLCQQHAKDIREMLSLAKGVVNLGENGSDTIKLMTKAACERRYIDLDGRVTRAGKNMRGVLASTRTSYAAERQAEDRYIDACHKFDLAVRRCHLLGIDAWGF